MNDEKLKQIEQEILSEIDKETRIETEIVQASEEIASHLIVSKTVRTEIDGRAFHFRYRVLNGPKSKVIFMVAADIIKFELLQQKYKPFTISFEMDERYSEKDNLKTGVEAFIRHITGHIRPDVLDDN